MNDMSKPAAIPAIGIDPGPDAALIALCAEHIANFHAYNDQASPDSKFEKDPLWHAYERTRDAINEAEPRTIAGMLAKARAAKVEATQPDGSEQPDGEAAAWAWDLLNDLIRMNEGAPEAATRAPTPRLGNPKNWALYGAREHLDDWERVHSIFITMSNALQKEIDEANATNDLMEPHHAEEFMRDLDWLLDTMGDRRRKLRKEIGEVI